MDGGRSAAAQWRSSIPGVWQQEGAPATLGIVASGGRGRQSRPGGTLVGGQARGWRRQPWRAIGLAGLALVVVVGIARAAETGAAGAGARTGWELAGGTAVGDGDGEGQAGPGSSPGEAPANVAEAPRTGPEAVNDRTTGSPDWWAVLAELDQRRGRALSALDSDLIKDYAQPGSAAWDSDAALLADLRARGLRPQGLNSRVVAVERSEGSGGRVQVQVVDQRSAYTLVDARGAVVESVPEAGLTRWWVTLIRHAGGDPEWRVADVSSLAEAGHVDASPSSGSSGPTVTSSGDGAQVGQP